MMFGNDNNRIINEGMMVDLPIFIFFVLKNKTYRHGNINSVKNVADSKPPITTVANGFCTSAPAPVLKAIGKKPKEATVAVINTGLSRIFVPSHTRWNTSVIPSFSN
ncbi:hypothetical protein D3C87_1917090 [compost metagenome]